MSWKKQLKKNEKWHTIIMFYMFFIIYAYIVFFWALSWVAGLYPKNAPYIYIKIRFINYIIFMIKNLKAVLSSDQKEDI